MSVSARRRLARLAAALALTAVVWLLLPGGTGSAHSTLTSASPAPDSRVTTAPGEIELAFNERLENKGYAIRVYDRKGLPVTSNEAELDPGRRVIRLALPPLEDGSYTVTYRLLSADGHPVRASYVFTLGLQTEANMGYASASRLHEEHDLGRNAPYWIVRGLYYLGLLAATGWVGLRVYAAPLVAANRRRYVLVRKILLGFNLAALLLLAWNDYVRLSDSLEASELPLLLGTSIGLSYAIAIPAAVAGLPIVGRWRTADAAWVLLLFAAKGLNGHAMGYSVPWVTYLLDVLHLAAASLWAGVLLAFAGFGTKRLIGQYGSEASRLSNAAFLAVLLLAASGLAAAALYTDGFGRLLDSQWGRLMVAKSFAVLLVLAAGAGLRRRIRKRRPSGSPGWLACDIGLLLVILGITAVFTYLNPLAATGPLFWHENVKGLHVAAIITPNQAGEINQFNVSIGGGSEADSSKTQPRRVTLRLQPIDRPDVAPIDVPLALVRTNGSPLSLYDYHYSAEGRYLSLPGKWKLEVRVLGAKLNEYVTATAFYSENPK